MKHGLEAFLEDLNSEVELLSFEYPLPVMAFTAYVTDEIASLTNVNEHVVVHCLKKNDEGRALGEIYGYGISENEEVLTLYYSVYSTENSSSKTSTLLRTDFDKAINRLQGFYNCAIRGAHMDADEDSNEYEVFKFIYDHQSEIMTVRLCMLSNCFISDHEIRDIRIDGKNVVHDIWDIKKLYANLYSGSYRYPIDLDFDSEYNEFKLPYIEVCPNNCEYQYVSTVFPAKLLKSLYDKYGNELLFGNLRLFLKYLGTKSVNANIRQTLREEANNLLAYSNGIVAMARSFEGWDISGCIAIDKGNEEITDDIARTGIINHLSDFRIVNGCQTIACIADVKKYDHSVNLNSVYVPVKIIILEQMDCRLGYNVTKNTHVQNALSRRDYDRSSQFDIKIEELSRTTPVPNRANKPLYWFYERIRKQYDSEKYNGKTRSEREYFLTAYPHNMIFRKEDLAKVWACWEQKPHKAVQGSYTATTFYMDYVANSCLAPDASYYKRSIVLLIIYKYLLSIQKNKDYGIGKSSVIAYSIAYLSMFTNGNLNFEKIWYEQDVSVGMKSFLDHLCVAIWKRLKEDADAEGKTILSYSKRSDVYDTIKMMDFGLNIGDIKGDLIERGW